MQARDFKFASKRENEVVFTSKGNDGYDIRVLVADENASLSKVPTLQQISQKIHVFGCEILKKDGETRRIFQRFPNFSIFASHFEKKQNWEFNIEEKQFVIKVENAFVLKAVKACEIQIQKAYTEEQIRKILQEYLPDLLKVEAMSAKVEQTTLEDAVKAQKQSYDYVKSDTFGIDAFDIKQAVITKNAKPLHENKERYVFGKNSLEYASQFTIQIARLSKDQRDPTLWIGFADVNEKYKDHMEQNMNNVIAMSDQKKFYINGMYHVRNNFHEDKPWITEQDIQADPTIKMEYLTEEFDQGDVITVKANKNTGQVTWSLANQQIGSCFSKKLQNPEIDWVPFVELWKTGDSIVWKN